MGIRERHLKEIVSAKYTVIEPAESPDQTLLNALEQSVYNKEITDIYKNGCTNQDADKGLGGISNDYPRKPGKWDISVQKGFRIELDEEQHFNRYRGITLNSFVYEKEKIISPEQLENYKRFCAEYEYKCPKTKGWWSNPSANKQFGEASPDGDFNGNGSSRWKQRSFYDYLKDVLSLIEEKPLIRISIYDIICVNSKWKPIGDLLNSGQYMDCTQEFFNLIEKRLEWWKG